jgi:hypothetical protein
MRSSVEVLPGIYLDILGKPTNISNTMSLMIRIKPRTAAQRESQCSTYSGSSYGQPRNDLALWVNRTRREELQSRMCMSE